MSSLKAEKNSEFTGPILGHFIDGKLVNAEGRTSEVFNPATGQVTKAVALAGRETYEMASSAAKRAFPEMEKYTSTKTCTGHVYVQKIIGSSCR